MLFQIQYHIALRCFRFSITEPCAVSDSVSQSPVLFQAKCAKNEGEFSDARVLGRQARDIAIASIVLGVFLLLVAVLVVILIWQTVGFDK